MSLFPSSALGPIPFRFSPSWTHHEDFLNLVLRSWNSSITRSPFFVWEEKLRNLKLNLKFWAKNLGTPMEEKKKIQETLERHQVVMEEAQVTQELLNQETEIQRKYHKICREEET
jgi:hypothetical protein